MSGTARSVPWSAARAFVWRHPEWWVAAVSAAAWVALIASEAGSGAAPSHHGSHEAMPRWAWMAAMVVAMMVPLMLPAARHVALTSLWSRRHRVQAASVAGYVIVWLFAVWVLTLGVGVAGAATSEVTILVLVVAACVAWQFVRLKRVALSRCTRTAPLASFGWKADRDAARFGIVSAGSCIVTCWGFMAVAAAAGHRIEVMGLLFGAQLYERVSRWYSPRPGALAVAVAGAWAIVL